MLVPVLTGAITAAEWFVDRQKRREVAEAVPERLLTDDYFEAMAEDIEHRLEKGHDLRKALKSVYREQGPVLLRPAPAPSTTAWVVPLLIVAAAGLGLEYWSRRTSHKSLVELNKERVA